MVYRQSVRDKKAMCLIFLTRDNEVFGQNIGSSSNLAFPINNPIRTTLTCDHVTKQEEEEKVRSLQVFNFFPAQAPLSVSYLLNPLIVI